MHHPHRFGPRVVVALLALLLFAPAGWGEEKHPVYVGARVCGSCHEGPGMGHQFSLWQMSKHSQAYAVLATPDARAMARISGIPVDPQQAPACLGCHATAFDAEDWERDPTFRTEDGVQCELCHGPGSEYMAEAVMRDPEAAAAAGLRKPTERTCLLCHTEKGSHVAVHHKPQIDITWARRTIAHPTPEDPAPGTIPEPATTEQATSGQPAYVGVKVCDACHRGAGMGYQASRWRLGPHARAYAVLATQAAREMAEQAGVEGNPQQAEDCLRCHATGRSEPSAVFLDTFTVTDGVGCEACHGAGSGYVAEAIMRDPRAALDAGLKPVGRDTCVPCHEPAHGKPFDYDAALGRIAHPTRPPEVASEPRYKTPVNLALRPDGREVWVACEASGSVVVVDVASRRAIAEIEVGEQPHDVAFSPDGRTAYVSTRLNDSVAVVDVAARRVLRTVPVGDEPHGLLTDRTGKRLYVLNSAADTISVLDTESWSEVKTLAAGRNPWSLARSPDGEQIVVSNNLPSFDAFRTPPKSELTVIDADAAMVTERTPLPEVNLAQGIAWHPGGEFAIVTLNRTKNLVPMTRIVQGWTITNGIGVRWRDGRVDQLLLDEPNLYFADAADVAMTRDGRFALVTSSGTDRVAVVDIARLRALLEAATPEERERVIPNHLGKSTEFVTTFVPTRDSPRGIVVGDDVAWVANALDDSLTVIDLGSWQPVERVDLGGPTEITQVRWGERLFHSANIAFQRQFSCHSCHPDGHVDGITYDIEPDGIGLNPVDNRTLRGIYDTAPFKWSGLNPTLSRQCGPRLAVFFTRIEPFAPDELVAVDSYIRTIPRPPNRHRPPGAELTEAQRRGKRMFDRAVTNDGRAIPENNRCSTCHFPPLYTDRSRRDVGTRMWLDTEAEFDVPHLTNIYASPPYMHNGIAPTLEEIWTRFNPEDRHGVTNDMTKDQLNDLIEYLKTL